LGNAERELQCISYPIFSKPVNIFLIDTIGKYILWSLGIILFVILRNVIYQILCATTSNTPTDVEIGLLGANDSESEDSTEQSTNITMKNSFPKKIMLDILQGLLYFTYSNFFYIAQSVFLVFHCEKTSSNEWYSTNLPWFECSFDNSSWLAIAVVACFEFFILTLGVLILFSILLLMKDKFDIMDHIFG